MLKPARAQKGGKPVDLSKLHHSLRYIHNTLFFTANTTKQICLIHLIKDSKTTVIAQRSPKRV
jgi:hypothetical protein